METPAEGREEGGGGQVSQTGDATLSPEGEASGTELNRDHGSVAARGEEALYAAARPRVKREKKYRVTRDGPLEGADWAYSIMVQSLTECVSATGSGSAF